MCGINGIFDLDAPRPIERARIERMNARLAHRGPDGGGVHLEPGLALGHRRLSIIDLSGGNQPMASADGALVIVFNGEIYNFREIRQTLEGKGYRFQSRSDTEVILYAWAEWGEKCVNRLNGMFAFALWDRASGTLFLARDRLGIKPLYYAQLSDGCIAFSSELKALLELPGLGREIEPSAVEDYFTFGYVPDPKTILKGTLKLPPAHTLTLHRGRSVPAPRPYWDVPFQIRQETDERQIQEELIAHLNQAVSREMVSDVPLGAFLSGGVDSSAVVAMMAGVSSEPVTTCSISFGDPKFNEAKYAEMVARRYQTHHQTEQVEADSFDLVDRLAGVYDEPFADSSGMPTYRVCALARKHAKVVLSGDGGDENFAGYRRHRWSAYEDSVRRRVPAPLRGPVFGFLGRCYPKLDWAPKVFRAKSTFESLARDTVEGYLHSVSISTSGQRDRLFTADFQRQLQGYQAIEVFRRHVKNAPVEDALSLVQYLDFKTYLPGDILTKVDRASMAHGLEVRVPILNHEFVEWVSGLPPTLKLRGREGKYIFKKALAPYLPDEVLYRPKMGFAVPLASWFRGPLKHRLSEAVLGSGLAETGIFDRRELERLIVQHQKGVSDFSSLLWALLMFEGSRKSLLEAKPRRPLAVEA